MTLLQALHSFVSWRQCKCTFGASAFSFVNILLVIYFLLESSAHKQQKTGVHVQLSRRIELAGLRLHNLSTISCRCCLPFCSQVHNPPKDSSLGKKTCPLLLTVSKLYTFLNVFQLFFLTLMCMNLQNLMLQHNTGYKVSDLQKSIFIIHELQLSIRYPDQKAIREKYEDLKVLPLSPFRCCYLHVVFG